MSRTILLVVALAAPVACAQMNDLNLIMTPAPSIDPVAAAQGLYLPGETVHVTVSLGMTNVAAPDVSLVQVDYSGSGPYIIDYESDAIVPGFPLDLVLNEGSVFAASTAMVPSPLTVPQLPGAIDFFTFSAFAPTVPGQSQLVSILGNADCQIAFAWTSDLSTIWRNGDEDMEHNIVGGVFTLMSVPEPAAVAILGLLLGICTRRGRRPHGNSHAACLALSATAIAALDLASTARAQTIVGANPPQENPWCYACSGFRDVLQPGSGTELAQGIGGPGTPTLGGVDYSVITVTFDTAPSPLPGPENVTVTCEVIGAAASAADCPSVAAVDSQGSATFILSLSAPIPPGARTTFSFAGTAATLPYEYLPGDVDFSGAVNEDDLIALQEALADGSAEFSGNLPRYDIDRSGSVDATDFVRLHELVAAFGTPPATDAVPDASIPVAWGVPAAWQADDLHWCRDQSPRNKVDDLIDASNQAAFDIVVNFKAEVGEADTAFLQALSNAAVRKLKYLPSVSVQGVPSGAIAQIAGLENVAFIEGQWGFDFDLDISAPTVCLTPVAGFPAAGCLGELEDQYPWLNGSGVNIAVIDTGVDDGTHMCFPLAAFYYDEISHCGYPDPSCNPNPDLTAPHGTNVASIALGRLWTGPDGVDRRGVATGAGLVDVRFHDASITCLGEAWPQAVDALEQVYAHRSDWKVRVINMSLHQRQVSGNLCLHVPSDGTDSFSQLVDLATTMGIFVSASAGNFGPDNTFLSTPAAATRSVAVANARTLTGTVDRPNDTIAADSARGPRTSDSDLDVLDELKPDVTAPGAHCYLDSPSGGCQYPLLSSGIRGAAPDSTNGIHPISGTSQATPHVAGLAALIMHARPGINVLSVKQAIIASSEPRTQPPCDTCDPTCTPTGCCPQPSPYPGWDCRWGWGYINAYDAASYVVSLTSDVTFPTFPGNPIWLSPDISVSPFPIQRDVVHTVTVQVKNVGTGAAQKVRVHFAVSDFSATPTYIDDFGTKIVDLPGNSTTSVSQQWLPRALTHKSFQVEIGFGPDRTHANNLVRRNLSIAFWSWPSQWFTDSFRVGNTLTEDVQTITFNITFADPTPGWSVVLNPSSVALSGDAPPANIQVTITPPLPPQSGASQTVHIAALIGTQKLGGVSIQATVP